MEIFVRESPPLFHMHETLSFKVPVTPYGKGRPRFSTVRGFVRTYTPEHTRAHEKTFKIYARQAMAGRFPFESDIPVAVKVIAYFPIPASYTKKRRKQCLSSGYHMKKPDVDNVVKAVLDAMNDCVYVDDAQVHSIAVEKRYTDQDEGFYLVEVIAGNNDGNQLATE